jgi:hypothetical protein
VLRAEATSYFSVNKLLARLVEQEKVNNDEEHEEWYFRG